MLKHSRYGIGLMLLVCGGLWTAPAISAAAEPIRVTVDARQIIGDNEPFWANMVFHPTEFLDGAWGEDLVGLLAETGAVQRYMRLYNQPEDAAVVGDDGTVSYRWDHFDRRADLLLRHGIRPVVAFFSMPAPIAEDPGHGRKRPFLNGKRIYTGPPKDYALWQAMCADFTRHVIERYGEKEVLTWYFTCWNEPDLSGFWHKADLNEHLKLYDHFAAAVKGVQPRIRIGGPSYSSSKTFQHPETWKRFLDHVTQGVNHATGERGSPIDYITVHTYGGHGGQGGSMFAYPSVDYLLAQQRRLVEMRDAYPALRHVPIVIAEWGVTSGGGTTMKQRPMAEVRNTQFSAAFLTSMVARQMAWRRAENPRLGDMFLCISGYEVPQQFDFEGKRTVHTLNGFHKPLLNGYKLLAKLGGELVQADVEPADRDVTVVAARDGAKRLTVLITRFDGSQWHNDGAEQSVRLHLSTGWTQSRDAEITHWRIDERHSNAYSVFRDMGSPKQPTAEQIQMIRQRMDLQTVEPPSRRTVGAELDLDVKLPSNAVSLIEIRQR